MKIFLRILKWTGIVVLILVAGISVTGVVLYNRKYDAPYPPIKASTDSTLIARGKHLVYSTAHCVECHVQAADTERVMHGEEVSLAGGGFRFTFPGGAFYARNISSDKETGIGNLSDQEIARTLRYAVKSDGTPLIPIMEFQNLSDEDLTAIVSYLRTTPAVKYKTPDNEFNLLGKAILAFFIRPQGPKTPPVESIKPDSTAEYGKYLVNNVSNCKSCHTQRDMSTGKYIGEELAGGPFEPVHDNPSLMLVTPNLTPDPETGVLSSWDFAKFKSRFSQGKIIKESIMPWGQFKHLDEVELKAIWNYLHTVKPVHKENGAYLQLVEK